MAVRQVRTSGVLLTALAVCVMLLLVMFAARTGPQRLLDGDAVNRHGHIDIFLSGPAPPHSAGHHGEGVFQRLGVLSWMGWIVRIGLVVLAGWLAYRGLSLLGSLRWNLRRPERRPGEVQFDVLDDPAELLDEMRDDASAQLGLLQGGSPRNAIVACWHRFEEQADKARVPRKPWETSSEFTLRLLDSVSADDLAVARLERLYHEARFSEHEIDEDRRAEAVDALERIHGSLPVRVRASR